MEGTGQLPPSPSSWPLAHQGWQWFSWPQHTPLERNPRDLLLPSSWPAASHNYWLKSFFFLTFPSPPPPCLGKGL